MSESTLQLVMNLIAKINSDVSYGESVIENCGEPCPGFHMRINRDRKLMEVLLQYHYECEHDQEE